LQPKKIYGESIENLLELLKEHEDNVRQRAKVELDTHPTPQVIAAVDKWEKALDKKDPNYEHNRLEALWVHQWHNVVDIPLLNDVLKSPEPRARAQAVRVLCYWKDRVPHALDLVTAAVKDDAPRVRLEGVRALSFFSGSDTAKAIDAAKEVMMEKDYYIDYCFRETMKQLGSLPEGKDLIGQDPILAARLRAVPDAKYGPTRKKLTKEEDHLYNLGKEVFNKDAHCVTCHQADGKGIENTYPSLVKSEWLQGDTDRVIKIVLKGLLGPLKINGKLYGNTPATPPMIGFGPLDNDEEIAAVISYVRQSFGNDFDFVNPADVKRVRATVDSRNSAYTVDEILKDHPLTPKK
jgi:mono/diheme cytochrome c family protein